MMTTALTPPLHHPITRTTVGGLPSYPLNGYLRTLVSATVAGLSLGETS